VDLVIAPTISHVKIDHKAATFEFDTGVKHETFSGVPIGLVKHRIMWPSDESGNRTPICRSSDSQIGFPRVLDRDNPHHVEAEFFGNVPLAFHPETNQVMVNCFSCPHRGDGRRKKGQDGPRCTPEWSLILGTVTAGKAYALRLRGSSLWAAADYLKQFEQARTPAFTHRVGFSLLAAKGNGIRYATLVIDKGEPTDHGQWKQYFDTFLQVREHLESPPRTSSGNGSSSKITPLSM
jgi:hypothetical protein